MVRTSSTVKIVFIQYGDYREAFYNLTTGGEETYKSQKNSVEYVAGLPNTQGTEVCVICVNSKLRYDESLQNGLRAIGLPRLDANNKTICEILDRLQATHIVLRTPIPFVIKHALKNNANVLPLFADYFSNKGISSWYFNQKLVRLLNDPAIPIVSNHNLPACESLASLGVSRNKIIPWDWAATLSPDDFPVKSNISQNIRLLYVGSVSEDKGCFDCIKAVDYLDHSKYNYTLKIIGTGAVDKARELVSISKWPEKVVIVGATPNAQVIEEMAASDIVIVPSRHIYPEGMPNTIYESLVTQTPLIVSDHPVFVSRFESNNDAIFFKASQPPSLAQKIEYLVSSPELYQTLSINSKQLWLKLQMPLKWEELISNWLKGSDSQAQLLSKFAIDRTDTTGQ